MFFLLCALYFMQKLEYCRSLNGCTTFRRMTFRGYEVASNATFGCCNVLSSVTFVCHYCYLQFCMAINVCMYV